MILKINENEGQKAVLSFVRIQQCVLLILATLWVGICSDTNVVLFSGNIISFSQFYSFHIFLQYKNLF